PSHLHAARDAYHDALEIRVRLPRWHEVDQADRSRVRLELGLEDESVPAVLPARRPELAGRLEGPVAVLRGPEERREHGSRIEAREAKPVDRSFAAHERRRLEITDEPVVLDRCHQPSSSRKVA